MFDQFPFSEKVQFVGVKKRETLVRFLRWIRLRDQYRRTKNAIRRKHLCSRVK